MWEDDKQHAPRACCESLMVQTLGFMQSQASGYDSVPTFSRKQKNSTNNSTSPTVEVHSEHDGGPGVALHNHDTMVSAFVDRGLRGFVGAGAGITPPPSKPAESVPTDISKLLPCTIEGLETLWPWYLGVSIVFSILIG